MKANNYNIIWSTWGVLLIAAGVLFLLQQTLGLGITTDRAWAGLWAAVFLVGGLSFLWRFVTDWYASWWAAIPGLTLLALGVIAGVHTLGFNVGEGTWLGALFLGSIGLGFWLAYLVRREHWWAVIPGGVLTTLAVVALVSRWFAGEVAGAIFFFGLATTFALVYLLPTGGGPKAWALVPAAVLAMLGMVTILSFGAALTYVWPLVLIAAGLYLLYRQYGQGGLAKRS